MAQKLPARKIQNQNLMKKLLFISIFLLGTLVSQAQHASAVFFSENGEAFTVIMNGLRKNDKPETNVKVTGLNEAPYTIRIIFADSTLGVINDKIYAANYKERTYTIKLKNISNTSKGLKKAGVNIGRQLKSGDKEEAAREKEEIENTDSKYVVKLLSEAVTDAPVNNSSQTQQPARNTQSSSQSSNVSTTTQTTTVSGSSNGASTGAAVNIGASANDGGGQFSMNININDGMGQPAPVHSQTQQTQTTTSTTHYVMPGYNGAVGCPWPMSQGDFESAKRSINEKSFEDSKLTIAKQIIGSNCIVASQVKEIMLLFNFEETRLDFAKHAYKYTYDINNYYKVNDAFTFESSIEELNEHIERIKN